MLYFSILLHYHKIKIRINLCVYFLLVQHSLLDIVVVFIYTHCMFRPSYKAIFRWIITLVTNIYMYASCNTNINFNKTVQLAYTYILVTCVIIHLKMALYEGRNM
jgi:hypothetical protein